MAVTIAAGSKLFIGPANSTADTKTAYEALTPYVEVGEIESIGEFGDQASEVTFTSIGDRRVRKFKGSFNAGTIQLTLARDLVNAGQADLRDALREDDDYAFMVTLSDELTPVTGKPTTFYFRGKVMSYTANIGNADNVVRSTVSIGINSAIVEVAAV
ncbi:MAG TPA: hypothetical protein VEY95_09225 [Azospirillaceae bacterium]|nr:hypothetical protein [Azospirillaceae bacterium]